MTNMFMVVRSTKISVLSSVTVYVRLSGVICYVAILLVLHILQYLNKSTVFVLLTQDITALDSHPFFVASSETQKSCVSGLLGRRDVTCAANAHLDDEMPSTESSHLFDYFSDLFKFCPLSSLLIRFHRSSFQV